MFDLFAFNTRYTNRLLISTEEAESKRQPIVTFLDEASDYEVVLITDIMNMKIYPLAGDELAQKLVRHCTVNERGWPIKDALIPWGSVVIRRKDRVPMKIDELFPVWRLIKGTDFCCVYSLEDIYTRECEGITLLISKFDTESG